MNFLPESASSTKTSQSTWLSRLASGTIFGSAVMMPFESVTKMTLSA